MILYLDTSSLIKLYVPETESAAVKRLVDAADVIACSEFGNHQSPPGDFGR